MYLAVIYMVVVSSFMISHRMWFSPDQFFVFAIFGALILGRGKAFIRDWGPFLFFYFAYEFLRGIVPLISPAVHIWPMIHFDTFVFGSIPGVSLQHWLYTPGVVHWYDFVAVTAYISYFVAPMLLAYVFWLVDRRDFVAFSRAFLGLAYLSFVTYIAFPAMPPWMAAQAGYIPPVSEVTPLVMAHFLPGESLPTLYSFLRANPVAAMPSLHAAVPFLISLFAVRRWKMWGLLAGLYVVAVWFAVLYLGEHYALDVIVGVLYAMGAFWLATRKWSKRTTTNTLAEAIAAE